MSLVALLVIQLLILIDVGKAARDDNYDNYMDQAINAFDNNVIAASQFIAQMAPCITSIGRNTNYNTAAANNDCPCDAQNIANPPDPCPDWNNMALADVNRLRTFFKNLNKRNAGHDQGTITQNGHSIVLWSGVEGMKMADKVAEESRKQRQFAVGRIAKFWTAGDIVAVQDVFSMLSDKLSGNRHWSVNGGQRGNARPNNVQDMVTDLLCLWLIFNSDISKPIKQYSSIDFNHPQFGVNAGKKQLLNNKVKSGLMINSYFWKVEMLCILKHALNQNVGEPVVEIFLKQYNNKGEELKANPGGWGSAPKKLFTSTKHIPVYIRALTKRKDNNAQQFEPNHILLAIDGDILEPNGLKAQSLFDLLKLYNNQQNMNNAHKLKLPLDTAQFANIVRLVDWTKNTFIAPQTSDLPRARAPRYGIDYDRLLEAEEMRDIKKDMLWPKWSSWNKHRYLKRMRNKFNNLYDN